MSYLPIVALLVLVFCLRYLVLRLEARSVYRYRSQVTLLTKAELNFYGYLRESVPSHVAICPKVRLWDVIDLEAST